MADGRWRENGFTITELLITIVVFAILIPVIANMIALIDGVNDRARDKAIINSLVENKAESLRSLGYIALSNGTTDFTGELPSTVGSPRSATYTVSEPAAPNNDIGLKKLVITVTYTVNGSSETLNYETRIGELGVGQY